MDNKTAIIFIGIQACGKSTFYRERFSDIVHINLDTLRTRKKENKLLEECINNGHCFVVDNTNPKREDRVKYIIAACNAGYKIIGYYFRLLYVLTQSLNYRIMMKVLMNYTMYI